MNLLLKIPQDICWKLVLSDCVSIDDLVRLSIATEDIEFFKNNVSSEFQIENESNHFS